MQVGVRSGVRSWERSHDSPSEQAPCCRISLQIATLDGSCVYRHLGPLRHEPALKSASSPTNLPLAMSWRRILLNGIGKNGTSRRESLAGLVDLFDQSAHPDMCVSTVRPPGLAF
jgi:hypothetical protein